jgi:hypothetical protein
MRGQKIEEAFDPDTAEVRMPAELFRKMLQGVRS